MSSCCGASCLRGFLSLLTPLVITVFVFVLVISYTLSSNNAGREESRAPDVCSDDAEWPEEASWLNIVGKRGVRYEMLGDLNYVGRTLEYHYLAAIDPGEKTIQRTV